MPPKSNTVGRKGSMAAKGKEAANAPAKKIKELPKELCGCGVDTYRPPPKGKKKVIAPVEHNPGCPYQRTTCLHYPHLPRCNVCMNPCKYCYGSYRWCPHCYEHQCEFRYKRVVHGEEPPWIDAGPGNGIMHLIKPAGRRTTTVTFATNNFATSPSAEKADGTDIASMPGSRQGIGAGNSSSRIK